MSNKNYFKLPRLYSAQTLNKKVDVLLTDTQTHYLKNVMRRKEGDGVRLFDGKNGEWVGEITALSKKTTTVSLQEKIKDQPNDNRIIRLVFSPIKKNRMDWMIEKMVELGVTEFTPVLFQNTEIRKINENRIHAQIFEAVEQCERFTIPTINPMQKLDHFLRDDSFEGKNYACLERFVDAQPLQNGAKNNVSFLIGPEGGFTEEEKKILSKHMQAIDLGETILRCETAAIKALVLLTSK